MTLDQLRLGDIWRMRDEADCLADGLAVDAAIARMALAINARLAKSDPLVFAVMNGGLILSGRLLPLLDFPLEVSYLHATRYGHATQGDEEIEWRAHPGENVRGRTVLVIDDVLDEGHTLVAIVEHLRALGANEVFSAVLVNKLHEHKARPGLRADFTGLELPDRFLFGCGMDYRGYWRNANAIYAVKDL
ncbi:MAG: hypoxanthine-guanine phosphoribosyltransferase [Azoarcus sp.]|jgi:hypoxanthine phosphoribosyltransferase|nr:hypoxanthine-guanine phosphoribosyltransferase [Azoarcus sp.]